MANQLATYNHEDGHLYCEVHGDLGEERDAVRRGRVLTTGEAETFLCLQCFGPEEGDPQKCEGCGYEYEPDDMAAVPTLVNLKDGTQRDILFCDVVCVDFWDETAPGDWVALHSGEEVQRALWSCDICGSVYEHQLVTLLVDLHDYDPDDHVTMRGIPHEEYVVCSFCQKKEPTRFKTRDELVGVESEETRLYMEHHYLGGE